MNFCRDLDEFSAATAIVTEESQYVSYRDLLDAADAIGQHVNARCLVFAVCRSCPESVAGYIGLMRANAVLVLVSHTVHDRLLSELLETYKPRYVYLPADRPTPTTTGTTVCCYGSYRLLRTDYEQTYTLHDDLALLLSTSGSTGSPELVRQSYKNIASNAWAIAEYLGIASSDRAITTMPMSYTYQLSMINSHLLKGASIILTEASLMEKRFWKALKEHNATTFGGVPYTYQMLKKLRFDRMKLPSLRYITQAGGKLRVDLAGEFAEVCAHMGIKFYVMYGQTEATARISYLPAEYARTKTGSVGVPIPGGTIWIEDEAGNPIEECNRAGELVYRGDNVTLGYAKSCLDLCRGDENNGTLHTGDVAVRDADGFYYIVGRKKRFLKLFGNRINLDEVEELMRASGYECACAGSDENLKIYVTGPDDRDSIRRYIAERTGINQAGLKVVPIDRIPRSESGKVLYSALD